MFGGRKLFRVCKGTAVARSRRKAYRVWPLVANMAQHCRDKLSAFKMQMNNA